MRVLIINTSERTGGAAVAANRLMKALNNNGVKAKMLVRDKETDSLTVAELPRSPLLRLRLLLLLSLFLAHSLLLRGSLSLRFLGWHHHTQAQHQQ